MIQVWEGEPFAIGVERLRYKKRIFEETMPGEPDIFNGEQDHIKIYTSYKEEKVDISRLGKLVSRRGFSSELGADLSYVVQKTEGFGQAVHITDYSEICNTTHFKVSLCVGGIDSGGPSSYSLYFPLGISLPLTGSQRHSLWCTGVENKNENVHCFFIFVFRMLQIISYYHIIYLHSFEISL